MSRSPTTPKFKIQMCQLYLSGKCTYAGLAETYNISKRTLREWVLKYNANCKCKLDTCTVEIIAFFKIKAHIHMNETNLNSQKAKHSERRVGLRSEEHPMTLP